MQLIGFKAGVEFPYFAAFRKPHSTGTLTSFIVPPYTTIRGLLSNALGLRRDNYQLQEWELKIGIKLKSVGETNEELSKMLKLVSREKAFKCTKCGFILRRSSKKGACPRCDGQLIEITNYKRVFSSSPIFREFLIQPTYELFLAGKENRVSVLYEALRDPFRPLYLGNSENLVHLNLDPCKPLAIEKNGINSTDCVALGIHPNSFVEKLPFKFHKRGRRFQLEYKTVSIPKGKEMKLESPAEAYKIGDQIVPMA